MPTELEYSYLAGLIDGEGCIGLYEHINKKKQWTNTFNMQFSITNTDKNIIEWIQKTFGGKWYIVTKKSQKLSECYKIYFNYENSYHILNKILPYLIIKKSQCKVAIEFLYVVLSGVGKNIKKTALEELYEKYKYMNTNGKVGHTHRGRPRKKFFPGRIYDCTQIILPEYIQQNNTKTTLDMF